MGWFTNSDDDNKNQNTEEFSKVFSQMSGTSVSRTCKPDPEDKNYLICKTVTQRQTYKNGKPENSTEEKEERVPVNQSSNNMFPALGRGPGISDLFGGKDDFDSLERSLEDHFKNFFGGNFGLFGGFFPEFFRGPNQEDQDRFDPMMPPFFRDFFGQGMNGQGFNSEPRQDYQQKRYQQSSGSQDHGYGGPKSYDYSFSKKNKKKSEDDIFDL